MEINVSAFTNVLLMKSLKITNLSCPKELLKKICVCNLVGSQAVLGSSNFQSEDCHESLKTHRANRNQAEKVRTKPGIHRQSLPSLVQLCEVWLSHALPQIGLVRIAKHQTEKLGMCSLGLGSKHFPGIFSSKGAY